MSQKYTVYTAKGCQWCTKVINVLVNLGMELDVVSIRHNNEAIKFLQHNNLTTVPQVFLGTQHIGGYESTMKHLYKKGLINKSR